MRHFNYLIRVILVSALFISSADARMYQWIDPDSGTTQLSGKPPAWYRGASGGPRVFVFDEGRLIDDTAVAVSDEVRQRMRQQSFVLAEEDRQEAQEKLVRSKELKEKFKDKDVELDSSESEVAVDELPELVETDIEYQLEQDQEQDSSATEEQMEQLKKIIADWEASQTESAKKVLE